MIVGLSKNSAELLGLLYKKYTERLEVGIPEEKANEFGNLEDIQKDILPDWDKDTLTKCCVELYEGDFIYAFISPNEPLPRNIALAQKAMLYMQSNEDGRENAEDDPMNVLGFYL